MTATDPQAIAALVERLRKRDSAVADRTGNVSVILLPDPLCVEAAAAITELADEIERLGAHKAAANAYMAKMCEAALARAAAPTLTGGSDASD